MALVVDATKPSNLFVSSFLASFSSAVTLICSLSPIMYLLSLSIRLSSPPPTFDSWVRKPALTSSPLLPNISLRAFFTGCDFIGNFSSSFVITVRASVVPIAPFSTSLTSLSAKVVPVWRSISLRAVAIFLPSVLSRIENSLNASTPKSLNCPLFADRAIIVNKSSAFTFASPNTDEYSSTCLILSSVIKPPASWNSSIKRLLSSKVILKFLLRAFVALNTST